MGCVDPMTAFPTNLSHGSIPVFALDCALLPVGGTYTMDGEEAVKAAIAIRPRIVIPMHHLKVDPCDFKNRLEAQSEIEVLSLQIGEVYHLK